MASASANVAAVESQATGPLVPPSSKRRKRSSDQLAPASMPPCPFISHNTTQSPYMPSSTPYIPNSELDDWHRRCEQASQDPAAKITPVVLNPYSLPTPVSSLYPCFFPCEGASLESPPFSAMFSMPDLTATTPSVLTLSDHTNHSAYWELEHEINTDMGMVLQTRPEVETGVVDQVSPGVGYPSAIPRSYPTEESVEIWLTTHHTQQQPRSSSPRSGHTIEAARASLKLLGQALQRHAKEQLDAINID